MATRIIPCRVCGKMFTPCNKTSGALGAFNYREIACSPECGAEYFRRVQAARQNSFVMSAQDATASMEEIEEQKDTSTSKRVRGKRNETKVQEGTMNLDE